MFAISFNQELYFYPLKKFSHFYFKNCKLAGKKYTINGI